MNSIRSLLGSLLVSAVCACASDPNKNAQDAYHAELTENRKQEQAAADEHSEAKLKAADVRQANATPPEGATDATKWRVEADAKVVHERAVVKAKATERLEKANARLNELKNIVSRAGPKATTMSRESIATVDTQKAATKRDIDNLDQVRPDDWKRAEGNLDTQLDTLESYVQQAVKEVDKFK